MFGGSHSLVYLELEDHVAHRFEAIRLLSGGDETAVASGTGARDLAEECLDEVRHQALVGVAVRRRGLVQDPHDALHSGRISGSNSAGAVQQ